MPDGLTLALAAGAEFGRVVQFAFHAPDIEMAAARWAKQMGAGPFFLLEHIALERSVYRGDSMPFDHSSAYGQCGLMMVELIHQHDDAPSAVRDMYVADAEGLHHIAVFVESLDEALDRASSARFDVALDATTQEGVRFVMVDARAKYGAMLEFYERSPMLSKFYDYVKRKSDNWDGRDVLRRL